MNLLKTTKPIQYITLAYAILYVLFILSGDFGGAYPSLNAESIGVYLLFILFIVGFSLSWYNGIITGILFLLWNVGMWFVELFLVEKDGGFGIISGIPLIVLGVFFILKGIEGNRDTTFKSTEKWKTGLQLLISTYTILYILVIISTVTRNFEIDFYTTEGIILIILLLIYSAGFILSWKKELIAGIIFLFWYTGVVYIFTTNFVIGDSGPWIVAGFVILIQSILYFIYHFKYKTKQIQQ